MKYKREQYVAPEVEIVECMVERGFAVSDPMNLNFEEFGEDVGGTGTVSTKKWWFEDNK